MSLKTSKNFVKMLRKSPVCNVGAAISKNTDFSWSSKSHKIEQILAFSSYLKFFSVSVLRIMTFIVSITSN